MNTLLMIGTRLVIIALISYSIAVITEQRKKKLSNIVVSFISIGILFDVSATIFMILGSNNTPFTLHGILGYSSLLAMLLDTILIWRYRINTGKGTAVIKGLHLYSRFAYIWWILAFITGGIIAMTKYM